MPNIKSAKKRLRQTASRTSRNRSAKRAVRSQVKKVLLAVKAGNVEQAEAEYLVTQKKLDRAGARNLIHRNAAARLKSRLSGKIKALKQAVAG